MTATPVDRTATPRPIVQGLFDPATWTVTYVVHAGPGTAAAIIDSVLDYDPKSGRTKTTSAQKVVDLVRELDLKVEWILETHAHADHLSAAPWLKKQLGGRIAIGARITNVQEVFKGLFHLEPEFRTDGSQFDRLLDEGDTLEVGALKAEVMAVPGHTPACVAYRFDDAVFVGDTLFMPDVGTARCDFPGGDAHALYGSVRKLLSLPPETRLFMCHDYKAPGRDEYAWETTVRAERESSVHVKDGVGEVEFVSMRQARDQTLAAPRLLLPSIQVNIRAGRFPPAESNGVRYLMIPVKAKSEGAKAAVASGETSEAA
jgi:glyoxylase-like metal-dependent hydrolase (beta-lactamase superfamily II)